MRPSSKHNMEIAWAAALNIIYPYLSLPKQKQAVVALANYYYRNVRIAYQNYKINGICRAGHSLAIVGFYIDPNGGRECKECRRLRRFGIYGKDILGLKCEWLAPREYEPRRLH